MPFQQVVAAEVIVMLSFLLVHPVHAAAPS
jgi:hypothetical protein